MGSLTERQIEGKLVKAARAAGGICPKFVSPGWNGAPDRILLLPGGHMGFVEAKAPDGVLRPLQAARHQQLRKLGFSVYVLNDPAQIEGILKEVKAWRP